MGWGDPHTSPEADLASLQAELDACRAEIAALRDRNYGLRQRLVIARLVAGHWIEQTGDDMHPDAIVLRRFVGFVLAAVRGENDPRAFGINDGVDSDAIRLAASGRIG